MPPLTSSGRPVRTSRRRWVTGATALLSALLLLPGPAQAQVEGDTRAVVEVEADLSLSALKQEFTGGDWQTVSTETIASAPDRAAGANRYATAVIAAQAALDSAEAREQTPGTFRIALVPDRDWAPALAAASNHHIDAVLPIFSAPQTFGSPAAGSGLPQEISDFLASAEASPQLGEVLLVGRAADVPAGAAAALAEQHGESFADRTAADRTEAVLNASLIGFDADGPEGGIDGSFLSYVTVVSPDTFVDALASGPLSRNLISVVVLADENLQASVAQLADNGFGSPRAVIIGGEAAVTAAQQQIVEARLGPALRVGGANRYATSAAVANMILESGGPSTVGLVRADDAADSISGAPYVQLMRDEQLRAGVLLVTDTDRLPTETAVWLSGNAQPEPDVDPLVVMGGSAAVSDQVVIAAQMLRRYPETSRREAREAMRGQAESLDRATRALSAFDAAEGPVGANQLRYMAEAANDIDVSDLEQLGLTDIVVWSFTAPGTDPDADDSPVSCVVLLATDGPQTIAAAYQPQVSSNAEARPFVSVSGDLNQLATAADTCVDRGFPADAEDGRVRYPATP